jgi:hypothetical protein
MVKKALIFSALLRGKTSVSTRLAKEMGSIWEMAAEKTPPHVFDGWGDSPEARQFSVRQKR